MKKLLLIFITFLITGFVAWDYLALPVSRDWSPTEVALIHSLSLSALPPLLADSSNSVSDNEQAVELGHQLFFDTRMSGSGKVSCATCHQPDLMFTDGIALAVGNGIGTRNTPSLAGISYSPWFYWDGRKDSQWAQALAPIEAGHEHNFSRVQVAQLIANDSSYKTQYETLFGALADVNGVPSSATPLGTPDQQTQWSSLTTESQTDISRLFSNVGKVLAAYQRQLMPGASRFDAYAQSLAADTDAGSHPSSVLNGTEIAGLRLFIDKGQCVSCHNGPLFTNHEFHNTGILSVAGQLPSMGRYDGIRTAQQDPFNCLGEFSDASSAQCSELRFARTANDLVGAHKTPTLRNASLTAPYMHGGQIASLRGVLQHYNLAPVSMLSHNEAKPLGLRTVELRQLEAFLLTLTAPLATPAKWLQAL
ncbi:MAG: cytochrome-c peroxidase [Gammaproteobacteria bacterium]|nr:cytochrome-c peroxidase [Gammaproteobacteria bacterium]